LVIDWRSDGRALKAKVISEHGNAGKRVYNEEYYFRCGLTWPRRTQGGLSLRAMPAGCIFGDKGPSVFVHADDHEALLYALAISNSQAFRLLVDLQMAFGSYEVGVIQRTPIPTLSSADQTTLAVLAKRAWSLRHCLDTSTETSHAFLLPALLQSRAGVLAARANAAIERARALEADAALVQAKIDEHCFRLYGIAETDQSASGDEVAAVADAPNEIDEGDVSEDAIEDEVGADPLALVARLLSWTVGVAFGRFDVRLAAASTPPVVDEAGPFEKLAVCSVGMLVGGDGLPCGSKPIGYPLDLPLGGILREDPGHPLDLSAAARFVFGVVFGNEAEARWDEAMQLLAPGPLGLRKWLADGFFEHHLKGYSKSHRKAPIYWQFGLPSGQYSVWLYAQSLTPDSFFAVQSDIVAPKLLHEERRLADLRTEAINEPSSAKRREIETQERLVGELRVMLEEVTRVARLWSPSLDDGTVLTMAPLWRLVPQHKAWQRELKSRWDELVAEKHEWAHTAIHLWPGRVVPKCATDRSLAIAHGLEDAFWVEALDGGRSRQRIAIEATIRYLEDGLVSERLSHTTQELRRFAEEHIHCQSGAGWWVDLQSGRHDDARIALALWPERVLRKASEQRSILEGLTIVPPGRGLDDRALRALLKRHRPRHSEAEMEILDRFCSHFGDAAAWQARWADFEAGRFDEEPLARFVHTRRVVSTSLTNHTFAAGHDLARWFWLDTREDPRRLKEPAEEVAIAVAERDRPAVKRRRWRRFSMRRRRRVLQDGNGR
jgi:hypothetical protein